MLSQIDTLHCQRNTKEDKSESMMHVLHVQWLAKRHIRMKQHQKSEKIKHVALSIVKLCLAGGIS